MESNRRACVLQSDVQAGLQIRKIIQSQNKKIRCNF